MSSAEDVAAAIPAGAAHLGRTAPGPVEAYAAGTMQMLVRDLGRLLGIVVRSGAGVDRGSSLKEGAATRPPPPDVPLPATAGAGAHETTAGAPPCLAATDVEPATPSMEIYLLSPFRVFANDKAIDAWPNCKGKAIFKYLVVHRSRPVPKEVLMDEFWPAADADAARNNLNVAIYGLRRALARAETEFPFVLFRQGCYSFNPELHLWVDAEAFIDSVHLAEVADQRGDVDAAIAGYRLAQALYHRPLLVDDRYEDWLIPQRQSLQDSYLKALKRLSGFHFDRGEFESCAATASRMLEVDACNEEAHRLLMRCYGRMGHSHLALRQYHFCVDALARELHLIPSAQTVALFQQIRRRQPV